MSFNLSTIKQNLPRTSKLFSIVEPLTPQAAQIAARNLLQQGLSKTAEHTLGLLLAAGVLPQYRLPVSGRALRSYHKQRLLDRLAHTSSEVRETLVSYGLPVPDDAERCLLYTLGPVGIELVKEMHHIPPAGGYLGAPLERVVHDLAVNEIVLRLSEIAMSAGWTPVWSSKYEANLCKGDAAILEPDAFLRFTKDGREFAVLIEYHNEDKRTRAAGKVRKYEAAAQSELWDERWEVETFPPVLTVYRNKIVAQGYNDEIKANPGKVAFYGRSLEGFFEDPLAWYGYKSGKKEYPFPWKKEE
jgi:hypothetical protein